MTKEMFDIRYYVGQLLQFSFKWACSLPKMAVWPDVHCKDVLYPISETGDTVGYHHVPSRSRHVI